MDGFKKVSEDKHKTVLKHDNGHEITIAHAPLSSKMRSQLKSLPMSTDMVKHEEPSDAGNEKLIQSKKTPRKPELMADGGTVQPKQPPKKESTDDYQVGNADSPGAKITKAAQNFIGLADGGEVPSANDPGVPNPEASQGIGSVIGHAVKAALSQAATGGGDTVQEPPKVPVAAEPQVAPEFQQAQDALTQVSNPSTPTAEAQQAANGQSAPQPTSPTAPIGDPNLPKGLPQEPQAEIPGLSAADQPGLEEGYKNQVQAQQTQANAIAAQGQRDAAKFQQAASQEASLLDNFTARDTDLKQQISHTMDDINNGHINPTQFWDNKSGFDKARIGIGFVLSGIGAGLTGQPNLAVEMLNKGIERDIDSQKANLGKKENLLGAMFKQEGNLRDAVDMTRIMKNAQLQHQIQASAATAQSPMAKAAAQQAIGKLQQDIAPSIYQYNMRKTLMGIGQGGQGQPGGSNPTLSAVDPATFLNLVPEGQRKAVADEVERAQNTNKLASPILQAFDKAADAQKGFGRIGSAIKTPRELNAFSGLMNTTVTDLTGTARQAEFDNVQHNFSPSNLDTAADTAIKRKALQQYLQAKSSAPLFKSYTGVGLDKFQSTNNTPIGHLAPHLQKIAAYAQANPTDPRSQAWLKKLGLN